MKLGAKFSPDRLYRYSLHRIWNDSRPLLLFVLLNPSTADETRDDPTIKRCIARAINTGFGGVEIVNIFAWRSIYPKSLLTCDDPVGPENDHAIRRATERSQMVICGWGKHGELHDRGRVVLKLIRSASRVPHALKLNADGTPRHPLYLGYSIKPFPMS